MQFYEKKNEFFLQKTNLDESSFQINKQVPKVW